jgi:nucleoid DNA-binding protein
MNITDYIVAYLKQGKTVELPGIGSFASQHTTAHYDSLSGTFFPTQETLTFSNVTHGDKGIIQYIAEQECIGNNTAEQMFKNYMDVLLEKLNKEHSHTFPGIGTLQKEGFQVSFVPDTQLNLGNDTITCPTLSNVKKYDIPSNKDPFSQFEQEFKADSPAETEEHLPDNEQVETPAEVAPIEAVPAEEPAVEKEEEAEHEEPEQHDTEAEPLSLDAEEAATEAKIAAVEQAAKDARAQINRPEEVSSEEKQTNPTEVAAPTVESNDAANGETSHVDDTDKALASLQEMEEIPQPKEENEKNAPADNLPFTPSETPTKKKKKSYGLLIVITILLILCLLGGGAYYYFKIYQPGQQNAGNEKQPVAEMTKGDATQNTATADSSLANVNDSSATTGDSTSAATPQAENTTAAKAETPAATPAAPQAKKANVVVPNNDFTLATDNITYTTDDIHLLSVDIANYLQSYVKTYVRSHRYSKADAAMMQKVQQYAELRLGKILSNDGCHIQDFFNYSSKDYMHTYYEKDLKLHHSARQRIIVQRELMNPQTLDKLLSDVLRENNVAADVVTRTVTKPVPVAKAASRESTKKGFDIIAGFYMNRTSADKMANSLKRKGCDAYIINKNGLYYVSMGSAGSQTEAEAIYHHIKEWYKGDVAIKKW